MLYSEMKKIDVMIFFINKIGKLDKGLVRFELQCLGTTRGRISGVSLKP